jgi:putative peptidoglycan lipid II flippase
MGLAIASDIGIALQTAVIAFLLHQRRMVSLASLDYRELGRCLLAAVASGVVVWGILQELTARLGPVSRPIRETLWIDFALVAIGSLIWLFLTRWLLEKTGSALPHVVMRRLGLRKPIQPEA